MFTREKFLSFIAPLHRRFRQQKLDCFFRQLAPAPTDSLLDVGGGTGIRGEFAQLYRYFGRVEVLNLHLVAVYGPQVGHVRVSRGDACALPYPDRSFDWVFSNAVIEHVGGEERQKQFAQEIERVARQGYFVATPNRYFPLEPHTLIPFYQFFSPALQRVLCRHSPGYLRGYEDIRLLSAKDLGGLFHEAEIRKVGVPFWPNNLIACRRLEAPSAVELNS